MKKLKLNPIANIALTCILLLLVSVFTPSAAFADVKKNSVGSSQIKDGSIKGKDIKDGTIKRSNLQSRAVGERQLRENAVTNDKIDDGAVTYEKLAPDAVYLRTVVVRPTPGDPVDSGENVLDALDFIENQVPGPSESNPWLVKLEPGVYDFEEFGLGMLSWVDIEGSGIRMTKIRGSGLTVPQNGVVQLASNAELRSLTVQFKDPNQNGATGVATTSSGSRINTGLRDVKVEIDSSSTGGGAIAAYGNSDEIQVVNSDIYNSNTASVKITNGGGGGSVVEIISTRIRDNASSGGTLRCVGAYNQNATALDAECKIP